MEARNVFELVENAFGLNLMWKWNIGVGLKVMPRFWTSETGLNEQPSTSMRR